MKTKQSDRKKMGFSESRNPKKERKKVGGNFKQSLEGKEADERRGRVEEHAIGTDTLFLLLLYWVFLLSLFSPTTQKTEKLPQSFLIITSVPPPLLYSSFSGHLLAPNHFSRLLKCFSHVFLFKNFSNTFPSNKPFFVE